MAQIKTAHRGKPVQVLLEPELHAVFKTICSIRGLKMTEISKDLIEAWVTEQKRAFPYLDGEKLVKESNRSS